MICRASFAVARGLPSSETATIPASRIDAMSAMSLSALSMLAAPIGHTRTRPCAFARSTMKRVIEALSFTGLVLGMQHNAVKPPRAAESVPVSMVSEFSWPGSRRCTCISMKPGATISPAASKISVSFGCFTFPGGPSWVMRSPSNRISSAASVFEAGSMTRPFLISSMRGFLGLRYAPAFERGMRAVGRARHQQIKQRHAHGDAVGDLLEHGRLRTIGNFGGDFHAPIDGTGMKDQRILPGQPHALGVQLVEQDVIALRERRLVQPLGLDPQHDDHVGAFQSFFHAIDAANLRARRPDFLQFTRHPHGRPAKCEAAAKFSQQMNAGAGYPGVRNVSQDGDIQIVQGTLAIANGQRIEQPL